MGVRALNKRHIRSLQKSRGLYLVSIPVELIRAFGWKERQKVEVLKIGRQRILIKDWKKPRTK